MGSGSDEVDRLRRQIDATRENLGEAVGALAYKADVKNRAKELFEDKKETLMEKVEEVKDKLPAIGGGDGSQGGIGETIKSKLPDSGAITDKLPSGEGVGEKVGALKQKLPDGIGDAAGRIGDATPSTQDVKAKAQHAASAAGDHPIALAAGAAAVGLAAGLALPETEIERQKLAPAAQDARQQAQAKAQDTIAQVKSAAQDAAGSTVDAVRQKGQEQGGKIGEMAQKAADKADEKVT
jgi:tryptophan synthase beta subunit